MLPANANVGPYGLGNNAIVDAAAVRCAARARASCTSAPLQARAVIRLGSDVAGLRSRSGRRTEGVGQLRARRGLPTLRAQRRLTVSALTLRAGQTHSLGTASEVNFAMPSSCSS